MATLAAPSPSAFSSVKVNVRLCGSVPRQELSELTITKPAPLSSRTLNTNSYLAGKYGDSFNSTHHMIEDEKAAQQLCTQLSNIDERQQHTGPLRPSLPEFEAPVWAVPASGESRLEVSMESLYLHAELIVSCT